MGEPCPRCRERVSETVDRTLLEYGVERVYKCQECDNQFSVRV